ncbi:MAG: helix-turn-helix domain-containing protein [Polyangia bacterium]
MNLHGIRDIAANDRIAPNSAAQSGVREQEGSIDSRALAGREGAQIATEARGEDCLWDANDVARFLGASRSWVYHQAEANRLPCIRLLGFLRFDPKAVRAFVQAAASRPAKLKSGDVSGNSGG